MHSSDETGDERKGLATTGGGTAAEGEPATLPSKLPSHAFRERIRRASVAAAQATDANVSTDSSSSSLLPPEQSGVHDRKSEEPQAPQAHKEPEQALSGGRDARAAQGSAEPSTAAGSGSTGVTSALRRSTPPAWPFAGSRDDRRPQYHTQLGLGLPQRTTLPPAKREGSESEMSDARSRMDTRDTKRSGAPHAGAAGKPASSPNAYKVTPARPYRAHDASKWSPTSTKPQRASLLRDTPKAAGAAPGVDEARTSKTLEQRTDKEPNIQVDIASSLDVGQSEVSRLAAAPLDAGKYSRRLGATALDSSGKAQSRGKGDAAGDEDDATRARRYTPKQRPTQRRGRGQDRSSPQAEANRAQDAQPTGAAAAGDPDPRELAVTVPDLRIPGSARPPALPLSQAAFHATKPGPAQVVTPDTPTQPRGRPVPRLPFAAPPASAFSPPAAFSNAPAFSPPPAFSQRTDAPFQPARSPFGPAVTQRDAAGTFSQHEASIVVDPALHGPFTEVHASQLSEAPSGYQPLPSDPAAFEQMMREQAAARGSRLNWKQQATLVIPRESLDLPEERRFINPKVVFGFLAASAAGALLMLGISQFSDQNGGQRVATDTSTSAAQAAAGSVTVIATEPSGAELLLDGAVVGNAPLEVVRPPRGQGEHTYVVRMRGFTQEQVRLSSDSQPAIRVTLTPESPVP